MRVNAFTVNSSDFPETPSSLRISFKHYSFSQKDIFIKPGKQQVKGLL
jgi:hypothetical protein